MKKTSLFISFFELDQIWLDEIKKHSVDGLGIHAGGSGHAEEHISQLLSLFKDPHYRGLLDQAAQRNIDITYELHALRYLLTEDTIRAHPDWQRVNKEGNRCSDYNFCCSNPEALQYVVDSAIDLYKALPDRPKRASFWLDDAPDAFCHCEKCAHLSPSDQQLIILNAIVDGLRTVRPDVIVPYLAYFEATPAPTQVKPHDGIYLLYAPYLRDITRPLSDQNCQKNSLYTRYIPELMALFGTKDATALDYWYDNAWLSQYKETPNKFHADAAVVQADMAYYSDLGFEYVTSFACHLGPQYRTLYGLPDLSAFHF